MKVSTRSRYGLRAMIQLAFHYNEKLVQIKELAQNENISQKYLESILIYLKKAKLVISHRGSKGGYELAASPDKITVDRILLALEDSPFIMECVDIPGSCNNDRSCRSHLVWKKLSETVVDTLHNITLADIIEQ